MTFNWMKKNSCAHAMNESVELFDKIKSVRRSSKKL